MTAQTKPILKGYFNTNDTITETNLANLIDTIGGSNALLVAASDASDAIKGRADYVCDGTADDVEIQAAIDALSGGGKVYLSKGTFNLAATVTVKQGIWLVGAGYVTQLVPAASVDAITLATGTDWVRQQGGIERLRITLPGANSGDGIKTVSKQASYFTIKNIYIDGGTNAAWGITLEGCLYFVIDQVYLFCASNGLRVTNLGNISTTFGGGTIRDLHTVLESNNTTAYYLNGNTNGVVNAITMIECSVEKSGSPSGTTGFYLGANFKVGTFFQCAAEAMNLGWQIGDGGGAGQYTFINCWGSGNTTPWTKNQASPINNPIWMIGGGTDFSDHQTFLSGIAPILSVTGSMTLGEYEVDKIMNTSGGLVSGTRTLTLPNVETLDEYGFRYTITNTHATGDAVRIAFQCPAGDNIIDTTGSISSSLTSSGAFGDSITLQNVNWGYWRVEYKIGTWT